MLSKDHRQIICLHIAFGAQPQADISMTSNNLHATAAVSGCKVYSSESRILVVKFGIGTRYLTRSALPLHEVC